MDGIDEMERLRRRRLQFGKGVSPSFSRIRERLKNGQRVNRKMLFNRGSTSNSKLRKTGEKQVDLRPPTRKHLKAGQLASAQRKVTDIAKGRRQLPEQKRKKERRKKLENLKKKQKIFGTKVKR